MTLNMHLEGHRVHIRVSTLDGLDFERLERVYSLNQKSKRTSLAFQIERSKSGTVPPGCQQPLN